MKQLFFITVLLCSAVLANAQEEQITGSGRMVQLSPAVTEFTIVELSKMNVKVVLETGAPTHSLQVSIDDNLQSYFRMSNENGVLKLWLDIDYSKTRKWLSDNNTVITIKAPSVLFLRNTGNTDIEIKLAGQSKFELNSKGNPNITLTGEIPELNIHTTGNSDIDAGHLICNQVVLKATGNSDIVVNARTVIKKLEGNNEFINKYHSY